MITVYFTNGQKAVAASATSVEDRSLFGNEMGTTNGFGPKDALVCLNIRKEVVGRFRWHEIIGYDIHDEVAPA
jgi:hypothetical protein